MLEYKIGKKITDNIREFRLVWDGHKSKTMTVTMTADAAIFTGTNGEYNIPLEELEYHEDQYFTPFKHKGIKGARGLVHQVRKPFLHCMMIDIRKAITKLIEKLTAAGYKYNPTPAVKQSPTTTRTTPAVCHSVRGVEYRGLIPAQLRKRALSQGFTSSVWGTYQQLRQVGLQVRLDEKSIKIITGGYSFRLFNVEQCKKIKRKVVSNA